MRWILATRQLAPLIAALALLLRGATAGAVSLTVSSANVAQPGDTTRVCVTLTTGGQEVAGTQNDLVWDGTCMTLNDGACGAAGSHGKQVNTRIQNSADFRMRVLVLSLSDVDPIDDGVLYCCQVQGEAEPGSCCSIAVTNTGASDSKGNAVGGVGGNSGRVCVQGSGNSGGGGAVGGITGGQLGASNAAPSGDAGSVGAGLGASGAPGAAAPVPAPAQVLQGGGGGVQVPTAPAAGAVAPPTALPAVTRAAPVAPPTAAAAAAIAPTTAAAAPTVAASAVAAPPTAPPTAADTPTAAAPTAVPTAVPPTQAPASTPTAARATPTAAGGWFGCQIAPGASARPPLMLALLLAAAAGLRRLRRPRR